MITDHKEKVTSFFPSFHSGFKPVLSPLDRKVEAKYVKPNVYSSEDEELEYDIK